MTDNEIINKLKKAADEITNTVGTSHVRILADDFFTIYNLINRKDAEIKKLTTLCTEQNEELGRLQKVRVNILKVMKENISQTKSEAIKEFAERLKEKKLNIEIMRMPFLDRDIDNLVKEMTEQSVNYGSSKTEVSE